MACSSAMDHWAHLSAISTLKCLWRALKTQSKTCPFLNQKPSKPPELCQVLGISSTCQFIKHHLQCFMPVPRDLVFVWSVYFVAPASPYGVSQTQVWTYPHRKQTAQCPACFSAWVCFHWIIHGKVFWSLQGNCGKKTEFRQPAEILDCAVSPGMHLTKVKSFYKWQRRQSHQLEWAQMFRLVFPRWIETLLWSLWVFSNFILTIRYETYSARYLSIAYFKSSLYWLIQQCRVFPPPVSKMSVIRNWGVFKSIWEGPCSIHPFQTE